MTRQKPRERLEKTLARVAREQGIDQERLRRWVSFLVLCGALDQTIQAGTLAGYYLKGGVAMELRFAESAARRKIWIWEWKAAARSGSAPYPRRWRPDST